MTHPHRVQVDIFGCRRVERLPAGHLGGGVDVIKRAGRAHKALGAEDLLRVQRPVGSPELDVPLWRHLAEFAVVGHGFTLPCPRRALKSILAKIGG